MLWGFIVYITLLWFFNFQVISQNLEWWYSWKIHEILSMKNISHSRFSNFFGWKIFFFGDLIFDRWVSKVLAQEEDILKHFKYRNRQEIFDWSYGTFSQLVRDYDFVWLNLETPIWKIHKKDLSWNVQYQNNCAKTSKTIAFCSSDRILPYLKNMWFNIFSLANNHSMDGWVWAHLSTVKSLKDYWFDFFWDIRHGRYFKKNYIFTWKKFWNLFAWHAFDTTIYWWKYLKSFAKLLKDYKKRWYTNFVAMHRWAEYQQKHSKKQEKIWKYLIDNGADLIIWTHPHVIQDIWKYRWKYIIYSLWNFLFDQWHRQDTQTGARVSIYYPFSWNARIYTWKIDAYIR